MFFKDYILHLRTLSNHLCFTRKIVLSYSVMKGEFCNRDYFLVLTGTLRESVVHMRTNVMHFRGNLGSDCNNSQDGENYRNLLKRHPGGQ